MSHALADRPQHDHRDQAPASSHTSPNTDFPYPSLMDIRICTSNLANQVLRTPVWQWQTGAVETLSPATQVWLKLELFQKTGTFKLRGALNCVNALSNDERLRGIVAVSAGNHAMAVAYTAKLSGISCKVVMPRFASPARINACRENGSEVLLADNMHQAFEWGQRIVENELRTMVHPYNGPLTALGTAGIGLELMEQIPDLDAVVIPIGGGGLCAGIASAIKQIAPHCAVYGVEPFGADAMYRSFQSGQTETLQHIDTVADSLCAPYTMDYSFRVCQRFVDDIVRVSDQEICASMAHLYRDMKLVAEPAAAVATAGLFGPLRARLDGKRVALIICGSNVDPGRFTELLLRNSDAS
ncbi:MAG: threonine/serine dehydratase [Burkholderiales bacterium]|nr:threonine/serine dehydratase [Burkholderiales bacterium]